MEKTVTLSRSPSEVLRSSDFITRRASKIVSGEDSDCEMILVWRPSDRKSVV